MRRLILLVVASLIINGYPVIANYATSSLFMNNDDHSSIFIPCKRNTPAGTLVDDPNNDGTSVAKKSLSLPNLFDRVDDSVVQVTSKQSFTNPNIIINGYPVDGQSSRL